MDSSLQNQQDQDDPMAKFRVSPEFIKMLCEYALVIIIRDEQTCAPTWLACKFCPTYGCKKRAKSYLMVYEMPFDEKKAEKHLNAEHPSLWAKYSKLQTVQEKATFFEGKTLPPIEKFLGRVQQLEHSKRAEKSNKQNKKKEKLERKLAKQAEKLKTLLSNTETQQQSSESSLEPVRKKRKVSTIQSPPPLSPTHVSPDDDQNDELKQVASFLSSIPKSANYVFEKSYFQLVEDTDATPIFVSVCNNDPDLWAGRKSFQSKNLEMNRETATIPA